MTRLVDADALKLSHCKECSLFPDKCMGKDCDCGAIIHINEMPTIEAEPVRHGKWIYGNDFHWYTASCNRCGYQRRTDIKADRWNQWNYCPNCGARMDEE